MYKKKSKGWLKHLDFIILDLLCLHVAFVLSYWVRHGFANPYQRELYSNMAIVLTLIDICVIIFLETLKNVLRRGIYQEFLVTVRHVLIVMLLGVLYLFSSQTGIDYSRTSLYSLGVFYFLLTYLVRLLWKSHLYRGARSGGKNRTLMIVTLDAMAESVISNIKEHNFEKYNLVGAAVMDTDRIGSEIAGIPVVATKETIKEYISGGGIDEILIMYPSDHAFSQKLLEKFLETGVTVHMGMPMLEDTPGRKQLVERVCGYTALTTSINYATTRQLVCKRLLDILGGLVGCLLTGIIFLFVAPAIYFRSPGPVFFSQIRVGQNGRRFKIYKFRSMYMDAEERKKELIEQGRVKDGLMFKMEFDPRVIGNKILPDGTKKTGIGQFIRDTSLDEFPQFWNVLKGDMSLVGTRPPTEDEFEKYELHHMARLAFKPGITGLWQVSGRSDITDFEEVVKLDTEYISNWNFGKDIKILLLTVKAVLKGEGAM